MNEAITREGLAQGLQLPGSFVVLAALLFVVGWFVVRRRRARGGAHTESPALLAQGTAHHRVRLGIYAVVLAAGGLSVFQAWQAGASRELHIADAEVVNLASIQRMLSQRIGRLAAALGNGITEQHQERRAFTEALERAHVEAQRLELLLAQAHAQTHDMASVHETDLTAAIAQWRSARQQLWLAGNALLDGLDGGYVSRLADHQAAVMALADPALDAAHRLVEALVLGARQRDDASIAATKVWTALNLMMLALLAVGVAEPVARSVRRQYLKLADQAGELERLALVAERTTNAVMITDARQTIVWVNQAFTRITGYSAQAANGQNPRALIYSERASPKRSAPLAEAFDAGQGFRTQIMIRNRAGQERWLDLDAQPLRGIDGELSGFVHVAADITERRLAQAESRVAAIAFDSLDAIVITDAHQVILKVNPAFTRITGYSAEEAVGQVTGRLLKSGRHDADFYAQMWAALKRDKHWQGEVWNRRKGGDIYPEWLSLTAVVDDDGEVTNYVAVFNDITQKKQADETIHNLAFYDPLTELPNRRLLRDRLQQTMVASARHQRPAAVLFMDLDHFKVLNDTKGHDHGDMLLVEVARRLRASVRANDTVARQGGDEFVVVLDELSTDPGQAALQAEHIGEKIREAINRPYDLMGYEHRSSPSIGIALFQGSDLPVDELLRRADTAMYDAKKAGRNAVRFFDPATQSAMEARLQFEADLRRALPEGQLALHFQPQVDNRGEIYGAEALLRWQHPQRGAVSPAQFIPVAEESDLIVEIGAWVLESACRRLAAWAREPALRHLQLAVNVSARQFAQPDFVAQITGLLESTGADPLRLKLELTESLVLAHIDDAAAKMNAIRALGVQLAMDDFGTGQSSLAYLTQLPLDELKIDRSFVSKLSERSTDAVIAQTIIGMARSLGLAVIAEGVETTAQHEFLVRNGCQRFQGYLFGRPVPLAEFEPLLAAPVAA